MQIRRISTKEEKLIPYKTYVRKKHVESILGTCENMTEHSIQFEYYDPTQCTFSRPLNLLNYPLHYNKRTQFNTENNESVTRLGIYFIFNSLQESVHHLMEHASDST
jgi:hypothetical protein